MGAAFFAVQRRAGWQRPVLARMRRLMRVGLEIAVRTTALLGAFLVASAVLARVGEASLAAHQIAFQLFVFLALVLDALAIAAQVLVGRSLGAGDAAAARAAAGRTILWSVVLGALFGVALLALRDPILGLFTPDAAVRRAGPRDLVAVRRADAAQRRGLRPRRDPHRRGRHPLPDVGDARRLGGLRPGRAARARRGLGHPRRLVRARGADRRPPRHVRRALRGPALGPGRIRPTMMPPMRRLAALITVLALFAAAPAAVAQTDPSQGGGGAFSPLPQPAPAETPVPTRVPTVEEQSNTDRTLLFAIGGGLLALFLVIGYVITRDARTNLPEVERRAAAEGPKLREDGAHRRPKQSKAKARAKTKAQRAARRHNR